MRPSAPDSSTALYCVGSSLGLMLVLVAVSIMSVAWMSVIAVAVVAEKLVRPRVAIDVPLALVRSSRWES